MNLLTPDEEQPQDDPMPKYVIYFLLSQVFKVLSLSLKESLVRSQPLNRNKFNFKISLG